MIPLGSAIALALWENPILDDWSETDKSSRWIRFLSVSERVFKGAFRGTVAATFAYAIYGFAIYFISKGNASREIVHSVWGWWVLIGFGFGLFYAVRPYRLISIPIIGALFLLLVSSATQYDPEFEDRDNLTKFILHSAIEQAVAGPDLPAGFWMSVFGQDSKARNHRGDEKLTQEKPEAGGTVLYRWLGCNNMTDNERFSSSADDKRSLCRQLIGDLSSPFVRSWFVMLFFVAGLGLCHYWEMFFRPAHYETHRLYTIDCWIAGWLVAGLIIIVVAIRVYQ